MILPLDTAARPLADEFGAEVTRFDAVERGERLLLRNVQVDVGSSEAFIIDSQGTLPDIDGSAVLRLENGDFLLDLRVRNNGTTLLEDVSLLFGTTVTVIGDLAPGETFAETRTLSNAQVSDAASQAAGGSAGILRPHPGVLAAANLSVRNHWQPVNHRQLRQRRHPRARRPARGFT